MITTCLTTMWFIRCEVTKHKYTSDYNFYIWFAIYNEGKDGGGSNKTIEQKY